VMRMVVGGGAVAWGGLAGATMGRST